MSNEDEIAILSAQLGFYSNKSNTHASFVIAGIFGMYALLVFFEKTYFAPIFVSYLALLIVDTYAFLNFSYYESYAYIYLDKLEKKKKEPNITNEEIRTLGSVMWHFHLLKGRWMKGWSGKLQWIVLFILWIFATLLPLIVVCCKIYFS